MILKAFVESFERFRHDYSTNTDLKSGIIFVRVQRGWDILSEFGELYARDRET